MIIILLSGSAWEPFSVGPLLEIKISKPKKPNCVRYFLALLFDAVIDWNHIFSAGLRASAFQLVFKAVLVLR